MPPTARIFSRSASTVGSNTDAISQNASDIARNRSDIHRLSKDVKDNRAGIAAAAALVEVTPSAPGKTTINLGLASFKDQVAVGMTSMHRFKKYDNFMINAGISVGNDNVLVRAGGSFEF